MVPSNITKQVELESLYCTHHQLLVWQTNAGYCIVGCHEPKRWHFQK